MKALIYVFRDGRRALVGFVPSAFDTKRHVELARGSYCLSGISNLEERSVQPSSTTMH